MIGGRDFDSKICLVITAISDFFESSPSTEGVESIKYEGTTNNSCDQMDFSPSNALDMQRGGSNGISNIGWWVISFIIVAALLFFYACFMVVRRRNRDKDFNDVEDYERVNKEVDTTTDNDVPYPKINVTRGGDGSDVYSTIDVARCPSALCGSCTTESSDDIIGSPNRSDLSC